MDNTEIHYVTFDPDEIWDEMQYAYVEAGGDILYPGDEKEMLLRSVQADIVQVFAGVDNALRMHTLRYAVGDYLDLLGEGRCERIEATPARTSVTVYYDVTRISGDYITVPAGSQMTADGVMFYQFTNDVILQAGGTGIQTADIEAVTPGAAGNELTAGTSLQLSVSNSAVIGIFAADDASGGNDKESDDAYRERLRLSGLTAVTTGPAHQYAAAAKAVSTQILDASALNDGAGEVAVYLLLKEGASASGIISQVENALSADDTRPLTDSVSVATAIEIPYTLQFTCSITNSSGMSESTIANIVTEYQDWQENTLGQPFVSDRLKALLYQAGATNVTWVAAGCSFDGESSIDYAEIPLSSRCKGTITYSVTVTA